MFKSSFRIFHIAGKCCAKDFASEASDERIFSSDGFVMSPRTELNAEALSSLVFTHENAAMPSCSAIFTVM